MTGRPVSGMISRHPTDPLAVVHLLDSDGRPTCLPWLRFGRTTITQDDAGAEILVCRPCLDLARPLDRSDPSLVSTGSADR